MCKIINFDAKMVENETDILVCLWDLSAAHGAGSAGEITLAQRKHIPIYLVQGMEFKDIPGWILGCVKDTGGEVFETWEEFRKFFAEEYGEKEEENGD
jgi:hypothetical protein